MKAYRNLYPQVCDWDNLYLAYRKARRGKRGRAPAATFEYNQEANLVQLHQELIAKTYAPGDYHSFYIHEPKRRLISAAPFRDRVVHHALCNIIEPVFERGFIYDSYANREGKGTHRALDRAQQFARRFRYVLQCDVRQFFPSVDHAILRGILSHKIADHDVLWLIDHILGSGLGVLAQEYEMQWFPRDDLFAINHPRGLPIGNLTSQFWANCYLNPLDHFVKRELCCGGYVRYTVSHFRQNLRFAHLAHSSHDQIPTRAALCPGQSSTRDGLAISGASDRSWPHARQRPAASIGPSGRGPDQTAFLPATVPGSKCSHPPPVPPRGRDSH